MSLDPLAPVQLGRTGLTVTRLGFGGAPLATYFWGNDPGTARSAVERALAAGMRLFDTAPLYGLGESERRMGEVLASAPRDDFVVATKVGRLLRPTREEPDERDAVFDFSRDGVVRSIEESLERLGLDRVDIVHIHDPDDHLEEALTGAFPALADLRAQGVISAVSVGQTRPLTFLVREADLDCILLAGRYTLLDRSALDELFPLCEERGVAVIAAGLFNSGVLADPKPGAWFDYAPAEAHIFDTVRAIRAICDRHGVPIRAAALRFPFGHPAVTCAVVGMRSAAEVDDDLKLFATEIPDELWTELRDGGLFDERTPVPGRGDGGDA